MSRSLADFLDRIVTVGLLRGDTTTQIADNVLPLTIRDGKLTPRIKKGSFASKASTQIKNTVSSSVWSAVNNNLFTAWQPVDNTQWVWNAVLDERLCPICSPLNGKIVPKTDELCEHGVRGQPAAGSPQLQVRHTASKDLTRLWRNGASMPTSTLKGRPVRSRVSLARKWGAD